MSLRLSVCIVEAKDVPRGGNSLYVVGFVDAKQSKTSPVAAGVWNYWFEWDLSQVIGSRLQLQLWMQGDQRVLLGEVSFGLDGLPYSEDSLSWFDLGPNGGQLCVNMRLTKVDDGVSAIVSSREVDAGDFDLDDCPFALADIERACDEFIAKRALPDVAKRPWVGRLLQRRRLRAVMAREYELADCTAEGIALFQRLVEAEGVIDVEGLTTARLWERYNAIQARARDVSAVYDRAISRIRAEEETREGELLAQQAVEVEAFEKSWSEAKRLWEFSKLSSELLAVRYQEREMGLAGEYAQARQLKARADALERRETEEAQRRAERRKAWEFRRLCQRHEMQVQALRRVGDDQIKRQEGYRQLELRPLQAAMDTIHVRKLGMGRMWQQEQSGDARSLSPRSCISLELFRRKAPADALAVQPPSGNDAAGSMRQRRSAACAGSATKLRTVALKGRQPVVRAVTTGFVPLSVGERRRRPRGPPASNVSP